MKIVILRAFGWSLQPGLNESHMEVIFELIFKMKIK
jgi:hypothetical protein